MNTATEETTKTATRKRTYGSIIKEAEAQESSGAWGAAATLWTEAKLEARRSRRESGTAYAREQEALMKARAVNSLEPTATAANVAAAVAEVKEEEVHEELEEVKVAMEAAAAPILELLKRLAVKVNETNGFTVDEVADLLTNKEIIAYLAIYDDGGIPIDRCIEADAAALLHRAGFTAKDGKKTPRSASKATVVSTKATRVFDALDKEKEDMEKQQAKKAATKKASDAKEKERAEALLKRERVRAKQNKVTIGDVLKHERRGQVLAKVTYRAERDWRYAGTSYTSISAAANAAAKDLKMKSQTLNGWLFWGVEEREPSA